MDTKLDSAEQDEQTSTSVVSKCEYCETDASHHNGRCESCGFSRQGADAKHASRLHDLHEFKRTGAASLIAFLASQDVCVLCTLRMLNIKRQALYQLPRAQLLALPELSEVKFSTESVCIFCAGVLQHAPTRLLPGVITASRESGYVLGTSQAQHGDEFVHGLKSFNMSVSLPVTLDLRVQGFWKQLRGQCYHPNNPDSDITDQHGVLATRLFRDGHDSTMVVSLKDAVKMTYASAVSRYWPGLVMSSNSPLNLKLDFNLQLPGVYVCMYVYICHTHTISLSLSLC